LYSQLLSLFLLPLGADLIRRLDMDRPLFVARFVCCVAVVCLVAYSAAGQSSDVQKILAHAIELHQSGDLEGAIREYKEFLLRRPEVLEARSNLGAALARLGRYEEAVQEYRRALAIDPANVPVRFNLAVAYYKAAMLTEAVPEFEKLLEIDGSNRNARLLLADCHLRAGEFKRVVDLLAPAEASYPDDSAFAYILGTAYIRDNQADKGQVLIDRILRNGDSAEAHVMLGTARLMLRDYPGAEKELSRALELNPKIPGLNSLHGKAVLGAGERDRALASFQTELKNNPNDFDANLYLGILAKEEQRYEESQQYLKRASSLRPRDLNVSYFLANVELSLGKVAEAQKVLEEVVAQDPTFVEAHVSLATAYYRLKRKEDGDRERATILKLNAQKQAEAPGSKEGLGPAYRGEPLSDPGRPQTKPPL